ncbi:MAG TPA: glycosyltransferase, partial [Mobilitalea sp.]|nr:glycosyltransferase [Mobilitalea sp.]
MRIAMLTNNYKPFVGGVPISIERLAQGLRNLGHEVYIFAPSYEGQEEEPYVIRYKSRKKKLKGEFVIPDIWDKTIEEKFAVIPFDIIHVHHPMLMGYIAQYLHKKYDIPIVFTYHTRYEQYLHYLKPYDYMQNFYMRNSKNKLRAIPHKILCD